MGHRQNEPETLAESIAISDRLAPQAQVTGFCFFVFADRRTSCCGLHAMVFWCEML
jgi:hypothetical protein